MSDFYVTLPSNSNLSEFPNNQPNNFKVRLAEPLRLQGGDWSVGLSSESLPDEKINLFSLGYDRNRLYFKFGSAKRDGTLEEFKFEPKEVLMKVNYRTYNAPLFKEARTNTLAVDNDGHLVLDTAVNRHTLGLNSWHFLKTSTCLFEEVLQDKFTIVDGVEFMRFITNRTIQSPLKRLNVGRSLLDFEDQSTFVPYEWVEHVGHDDLRILKKNYGTNRDLDYVRIGMNLKLAVAMGWFTDETNWRITQLGNNLVVDGVDYPIRRGPSRKQRGVWYRRFEKATETLNGIPTRIIYLNPYYTWRFLNFKSTFQAIMGSPSRTLLIYSDVVESSKVGDQVVDLLRKVEYKREGKATAYFEPLHIQYLPPRNKYIEKI